MRGAQHTTWGQHMVHVLCATCACSRTTNFESSLLHPIMSTWAQECPMRSHATNRSGQVKEGLTNPPPPTEVNALIDSYSFRRYSCTSTSNRHKVTSLSHVASSTAVPFHCTKKSMRQFLRLAPMVLWLRIFSTLWLNYFITTDIACFSYTISLSKSS